MRFLNHHSATVIVLELKMFDKRSHGCVGYKFKGATVCAVGGGKTMTPHAAQQK